MIIDYFLQMPTAPINYTGRQLWWEPWSQFPNITAEEACCTRGSHRPQTAYLFKYVVKCVFLLDCLKCLAYFEDNILLVYISAMEQTLFGGGILLLSIQLIGPKAARDIHQGSYTIRMNCWLILHTQSKSRCMLLTEHPLPNAMLC